MSDAEGSYLRAGHAPDVVRKLRRMHWSVEEEADLHGLTALRADVVAWVEAPVAQGGSGAVLVLLDD